MTVNNRPKFFPEDSFARIVNTVFICACALSLASCAALRGFDSHMQVYRGAPDIDITPRRQAHSNTCAVPCIQSVLEYWGGESTRQEIKSELGRTPREGYTLGQLRDLAENHGFYAYIVSGDLAFLKEHIALGRPVIVTVRQRNLNHSIVVAGFERDGSVIAMDPEAGKMVRISLHAFLERWERLDNPALLIAPGPGS